MQDLIPLQENNDGRKAVLGRDLHQFLQVKTPYTMWIQRHIEKYGFIEGQDYVHKNVMVEREGRGAVESRDHILTLDMAKELSMVQNNTKGREARRYFIEVERRWQQGEMSELDEAKLVQRALQVTYRQVQQLEAANAEMAPKAAYVDTYVADEDLIQIRTIANQLNIGEQALRNLLIEKAWIYRIAGQRWSNKKEGIVTEYQYRPHADKKAYFRLIPCHEAPRINGEVKQTLKVTPMGAERIAAAVKRWNNPTKEIEITK